MHMKDSQTVWNKILRSREELMEKVESYKPAGGAVSQARVLFLGPVGAGKSSFISSVQSIFSGRVLNRAMVGSSSASFTKKLQSFQIRRSGEIPLTTSLVLCDIMGIGEGLSPGLSLYDALCVIKGHVIEGHQFSGEEPVRSDKTEFIKEPSLKDKIHCVVFVVDASKINSYAKGLSSTFQQLREKISSLGVHQVALLTHVDEVCTETSRDISQVYRSCQVQQLGRKKRVEKPRRKITARELRKVKRAAAKMPLATSLAIFQSCNITGVPKSTRCAILRDMAKVRKAESRPPLNKTHKLKRQDWAKKYLKTDFSKVLWTDKRRVSLDGPDGWARGWIGKGQRAPVRLRRQQGGGGVLVWAGIIKDELVGPFRVEDGVKLNSQSYCQFLEDTFFKQWYRKKSASFKKNMIFMQDNAPSHTSKYSTAWLARKGIKEENLMIWPPCSPDLNPIENLWSIIKCAIYKEGKQYTSLNSVWEAVVAAARNVDGEQIKTLTESMDGRLLSVLAKKGGYIGH
ncbi:interferon-induced protein 44-like [Silurus asotus]|uniref:Interferon-induced protein 44-like n=1 Tax=Silurus asotus TaxID=30991 RepID=A0AAD5A507_SILAS|nr:interferon-induced protein 44-like [Silurus asotus]